MSKSILDYFHTQLQEEFHKFRLTKTNDINVEINGVELASIIATSKIKTLKNYPKLL